MKRRLELFLLFLLALESVELVWRRIVWNQSPPEFPPWAWGTVLVANTVFAVYVIKAWRKGASLPELPRS